MFTCRILYVVYRLECEEMFAKGTEGCVAANDSV
jgi:hypothetical protein